MGSDEAVLSAKIETAGFGSFSARPAGRKEKPVRRGAAQTGKKAVTFQTVAASGSRVFVAGSFNGWDPFSHPLEYHAGDGVFKTVLYLTPGYYEYKFVIDGFWHIDSACPNWVLNDSGGLNSVIHV